MSAPLLAYPTGWTLAVLDDPARTTAAIGELTDAGVAPEDMAVLATSDDTRTLERLGASRGVAARIRRATQFLTMDQMPDLHVYERAVAEGHHVVAVHLDEADERRRAIDILRRHGAHFVNRFGAWATEEIVPWHGTMPRIPEHLHR